MDHTESGTRSMAELANAISAWILSERDEWRKTAYAHAHITMADAPLQAYLIGLIEAAEGNAVERLRESLTEQDWRAMRATSLPWTREIWGAVAVDIVVTVGLELRPGQYRQIMDAFTKGLEGDR